jgi:hypothetical protein
MLVNAHENGADAATSAPNSEDKFGIESNNFHADCNPKSPTPQTFSMDRGNLDLALRLHAAGYCPLPVAPAHPAEQYPAYPGPDGKQKLDRDGNPLPRYTGKNPSFLHSDNRPEILFHGKYKDAPPREEEIRRWFANPANGIGLMGGYRGLHCIDLDRKDFPTQEACDEAFLALQQNPLLAGAPIDRTPGGGYHFLGRLNSKPSFTNFSVTEGGHHAGELLGHGRFFVIAPTLGPNGKSYETIQTGEPPLIENLGAIGIHKYSKTKPAPKPSAASKPKLSANTAPGSAAPIDLAKLVTDNTRSSIAGDDWKGDRSETLATAAHDIWGWANWCQTNNVPISGDPESLVFEAGRALELDDDRIERIIKTVDIGAAQPSCVMKGGDESAWKRVRKLEPAYKPAKAKKVPKPIPFEDSDHKSDFHPNLATGLNYTKFTLVGDEVVPEEIHVGDYIELAGHTNSTEGDCAGLYLKFKNQRGHIVTWTMPRRLIGDLNAAVSELATRGYKFVYEQKKLLFKYLAEMGCDVDTAYTIAPRTGWVEVDGVRSFVLHAETIGDDSIRYLDVEPPSKPLLKRVGDLQSWQQTIGAMAAGNSRLIGAIGMGLAPCLLGILEIEGGGLHYFGASSTGKTTALSVAISVTGEQRPATWNSTANGLEAGAEAHSDLLYPIDEIGQALPKTVDEASYNLANGAGRTRMTKDLRARKIKTWCTLFFSTGEFAMLPFLKTAGITTKGGQEARMPSIPADAGQGLGLFDTIHGVATPQEFADELKTQGQINKGTVLAAFLDRLVPLANTPEWIDRQRSRHQAITNQLKGSTIDPDGTVGRVARRFALIQLALELGQSWGVTLFPEGQVEWAIQRLFTDWIAARGGAGSIDIRQACDRIEALFVGAEFGDRIRHLTGERRDTVVRNLLAIKRGEEFLVPVSVFNTEIAQGVDRQLLIAELQKRGWIAPPGADNRPAVQRKIEGQNGRYFAVYPFWNSDECSEIEPVTKTEKPLVTAPVTAETVTGPGFDQVTKDIAGNQGLVTAETVAVTEVQPSGNQVTAISGYEGGIESENKKSFDDHVDIDPDEFDWAVAGAA